MSRPDDPRGHESVWARLEREDREDAKRNFWPGLLLRTALWPLLVPVLADVLGRPLPPAVRWVAFSAVVVQLTLGWLLYRSNRRRP